jgi:hypothetical protein
VNINSRLGRVRGAKIRNVKYVVNQSCSLQEKKNYFDVFVGTFTDESPETRPVLPPAVGALAKNALDTICFQLPSAGNLM